MATAAGLAAGAVIGLILAPEKGTKTRKKIKKTLDEFVEGNFPDIGDKLKDLIRVVKGEKPGEKNVKTEH